MVSNGTVLAIFVSLAKNMNRYPAVIHTTFLRWNTLIRKCSSCYKCEMERCVFVEFLIYLIILSLINITIYITKS